MRVAYILNDTSPTNGATKAFMQLLRGVMIHGVQPYVITPNEEGIYQTLKATEGVSVLALNYRPCAYPRLTIAKDYLLFIPKLIGRILIANKARNHLTTYLQANKIDIVHTNVSVIDIGYEAAKTCNIPHIFHIREYGDKLGLRFFPTTNSFMEKVTGNTTYSICITKGVQEHFALNTQRRSRVIYDCVPSKNRVMPRLSSRKYFLYAGRLEANKGLDLLLEAYDTYVHHTQAPIPLYIAGSSVNKPYRSLITQYVESHHLETHLHFLGDRQDLNDLMQGAIAMIVPSRHEGFGLCLAEAMLNGCLTIGYNTTGTKEQFDNGVNMTGQEIGLRYNTIEQLADLLGEVSNQPISKYDSYREQAFQVVSNLYTVEHHVEQVCHFYQDIMHKVF